MSSLKESLQLRNTLLSRSIAIEEDGSVYTESLRNVRTGREFIVAPRLGKASSREFSILWKGRWLQGNRPADETPDFMHLHSAQRAERPGVQRLEIYLTTASGDLQVQIHYEIYENYPIVRKWLTISNEGDAPGLMKQLLWEDLALTPGNPSDLEIASGVEAFRSASGYGGKTGDSLLLLNDTRSREGIAVVNEESGPSAIVQVNPEHEAELRVGFAPSFEGIMLHPGESFHSAPATLILADQRYMQTVFSSVLHDYASEVLCEPHEGDPPIVYRTTDVVRNDGRGFRLAPGTHFASIVGITKVCLEGGGFCRPGGFDVDPLVLPGGMSNASKVLAARDLTLGVSIPLAALDPSCEVAQEHPEWMCQDEHGEVVMLQVAGAPRQMACLVTEYLGHLFSEIRKLYERDGVRLLHLTGPAFVRRCHATAHRHFGTIDSAFAAGRSLQTLLQKISNSFPDLILGLDHDVLGESAGLDFALLNFIQFYHLGMIPEVHGRRTHLEIRRQFYRYATRFPTERLAIGDLRVDGANPVASVLTALAGMPVLSGSMEKMAAGQLDWLRGVLEWYQSLGMGISYHQRFYLLQSNGGGARSMAWDGYARLSKTGEGFACVFRNGAANAQERFSMPGLDMTARYRLDSIVRDRALGIFTATDLADGFPFELNYEDGADLIEIRRVEG